MKRPIVFMYSGQGAQYYQMGKELYEQNVVFRDQMHRCDAVVKPLLGESLVEKLFSERKTIPFARTLYTHPANVMVSYCLTQVLISEGVRPDLVLGYSLGEVCAALVAGAMDMERCLSQLVRQAQALEAKAPAGGMMAVLADPGLLQRRPELFHACWMAGHNFPDHFVLTAVPERLKQIEKQLFEQGTTTQILPISHGFHSPLIDPVKSDCLELFSSFDPCQIPVYSSYSAQIIRQYDAHLIWNVVRQPIRFLETVRLLEAERSPIYVDVGPAGTLTTFARYALGGDVASRSHITINQFGRDQTTMTRLIEALRA